MAVDDDKIADFTVDNYAALKLKHPQRETCSAPDPTDIDCFSTSEFFVHKGWAEIGRRYGIKNQLVLGSTYQIFEWDRKNSDRNFDFRETNRIAG